MNDLTTIIFSKNRACQCEILLRSLNLKSTVIYTHDEEYKQGYVKLRSLYPEVDFIEEVNFKNDIINNLGDYTMFLCDDDIMLESFDVNCKEFKIFQNNEEIVCLSIRLASYYKGTPEYFENNVWIWRGCYRSWGYPMSVSATIFRKSDILPIMEKCTFDHPIELEVVLRNHIPDKMFMMCCDNAKIINNLVNQTEPRYSRYRTARQSLIYLEELFLSGKRICLEKMREKAKKMDYCFMVEPYEFE
jgi:hypothetical protein